MRRPLAHFFFVTFLGGLAMVLGVVTSLTLTPPGRDLLARTVSEALDRVVHGRVDVGSISGSFLYDLTIEDLVVRDTSGVLLAALPRVRVSYRIPNLLAGRFVAGSIQLDRPFIQLIQHRNGRMNFEEVLGLGEGPGGGRPPLLRFENVEIDSGLVRLAVPWNPPESATTEAARDSALAAERAEPGRVIEVSSEGLRRVYQFDELGAVLPLLRISTPDRDPIQVDIDSLATRINDPNVTIEDAAGRIRVHGDTLVFSLTQAALPNSRLAGGGTVTWPRDTVLFDFQLIASRADLADLRWISPAFPDLTGRGVITATSVSGTRTLYTLRDLYLTRGPQVLAGDLVTIVDRERGLGFRDLDLRLERLNLDAVRGFLDTLPFYGTVTGTVQATGFLEALDVAIDWDYADAQVSGTPISSIAGSGRVLLVSDGLVFRNFEIRRSDIALGTVQRIAPAVDLTGRLMAVGRLNGPLQNATFLGVLRHQDGERPASVLEGLVHLDTRSDTLGLDVNAVLDPLSLAGLQPSYPRLPELGALRGRVRLGGTLANLRVDATLAGGPGQLSATGEVRLLATGYGARDLRLEFTDLNLAALGSFGVPTRLTGTALVDGVYDSAQAPDGTLRLELTESRIREWRMDTLFTALALADSTIVLDTLHTEWDGGEVAGAGRLGWAQPRNGRMTFALLADSLRAFDSLALAVTGMTRDTAVHRPLSGTAEGRVVLDGSLDSLGADVDLTVRNLAFQDIRSAEVAGTLEYAGGTRPTLATAVRTDSVSIGRRVLRQASVAALGQPDSLTWGVGITVGDHSRLVANGEMRALDTVRVVEVDSLRAMLASHVWRLQDSVTITLDSVGPPLFTPMVFTATDGSGVIRIGGEFPGETPGDLTVEAAGIGLRDVYALFQRDTAGVGGAIGAEFEVGGTREAPTIEGDLTLADVTLGQVRIPSLHTRVSYAEQLLNADLALTSAGDTVLVGRARLPLDLALAERADRTLPGELRVRVEGDSVDFSLIEAVAPSVDSVRGAVNIDARVDGTWNDPQLQGFAELLNGALSLPGLGIRLGTARGGVLLAGDSLQLLNVYLASGGGGLDVNGVVRLDELTHPVLDLDAQANEFEAINAPDFLELTASGDIQLRGPVYDATVTGRIIANSGVLYFADLINKRVIDLSDPSYLDLIDTTLLRRREFQPAFQSRFLDSLRINDLEVVAGDDFWLRSGDANIQLAGSVLVDKVRDEYTAAGTLNALRGTYTLRIGPVTRDFTVEEGTVRYFGTPDLNAELDIRARHVVQASQGEIPVVAHIGGTLLQPELDLSSATQLPLPEVDVISYIIFGVPASQAERVGRGSEVATAVSYFTSAAFSELERALLGFPVDLIEIRPGLLTSGGQSGATVTQVVVGWQIGRKVFLTLSAGLCTEQAQAFGRENLGASLELRFSQEWRSQLSFEPTFPECGFQSQFRPTAPYQVGVDFLYETEF